MPLQSATRPVDPALASVIEGELSSITLDEHTRIEVLPK